MQNQKNDSKLARFHSACLSLLQHTFLNKSIIIKGGTDLQAITAIRFIVAYVFVVSGVMKFVSAELSNFFISLGFPYPIYFKNILGFVEIICGIFLLVNYRVKSASIPLIFIMIGALITTKLPLIKTSMINFAFQARLDIVVLILLIILFNYYHRES